MRRLRWIASALLAFGLLGTFLWGVDWSTFTVIARSASPTLLALGWLANGIIYGLRGWRWKLLLRPVGAIRWQDGLWANAIGFAVNAILPARIGELVRAVWLQRRYPTLSLAHVIVSVGVERMTDFLVFLTLLAAFAWLGPQLGWFHLASEGSAASLIRGLLRGAMVMALGILGLILGLTLWTRWGLRAEPGPSLFRRLVRFVRAMFEGFLYMGSRAHLTRYTLVTAAFWFTNGVALWLTVLPFVPTFPLHGAVWTLVLVVIGVLVPTPGFVGGYHWGMRIALTWFYGVDTDRAVVAAIWSHFCALSPAVLLTAGYITVHGMSWRKMLRGYAAEVRREVSPMSE